MRDHFTPSRNATCGSISTATSLAASRIPHKRLPKVVEVDRSKETLCLEPADFRQTRPTPLFS